MRISLEYFSLKIYFYNVVKCDSPSTFVVLYVFQPLYVFIILTLILFVLLIIKSERKCKNFTKAAGNKKSELRRMAYRKRRGVV